MGISLFGQKVSPLVITSVSRDCLYRNVMVRGFGSCVMERNREPLVDYVVTLPQRLEPLELSVVRWNELIRNSVRFGSSAEVIGLYRRMLRLGCVSDEHTFPYVLKACGELSAVRLGKSVHATVLSRGFSENVFVCNAIVSMYGRCGSLFDARKMFEEMKETGICDVVSWNSIVAAYSQNGDPKSALEVFRRMRKGVDMWPNAFSLVNVLSACGSLGSLIWGRQVHGFAVRRVLFEDMFVGNAVVDMYAKCERMVEANRVFERMEDKDVVTWNAMVTGYSRVGRFEEASGLFEKMKAQDVRLNVVTWSAVIAGFAQRGLGNEALDIFRKMQASGFSPNCVTFVSLLSGCASAGALLQGKEAHCYAVKWFLYADGKISKGDLMIINGLVDMYSKCNNLKSAQTVFDLIGAKERQVGTWTTMIGGHAQHGEANDALLLFTEMVGPGNYKKPSSFTIPCVLMACARLGALRLGKQIHTYVIRNGYEFTTPFISNCLIDMYSKSGDINIAEHVFNKMKQRNIVSWTSLMAGYGMHGLGREAVEVFSRMKRAGLPIDGVALVVVLYACSHSGLIDEGMGYFNCMSKDFGVTPGIEHYACMVDLLGRGGRLTEALEFIKSMPIEPNPVVWHSLLSCCRLHSNVEIGEYTANKLLELKSLNDGSYTLLSNIYANARKWKDVARIRSSMKHTGVKKRPGCSWVQDKEGTMTFFVGDRHHPRSQEIYDELSSLIERIKAIGYVTDTSFALHDVGDEEKDDLLFEHSEKLALAYAILTTPTGTPIRITKNLRVCGDCHSAMTYVSMIVDHEIILRDSSRFHHFKKGSCSCRGYW